MFRTLLRAPRASELATIEGVGEARIEAPSAIEEATAIGLIDFDQPAASSKALAARVALSICYPSGGRVFRDGADMARQLDVEAFDVAAWQVWSVLVRIAPSCILSDEDAWDVALREGVAAPSNRRIGERLALSVDVEIGPLAIPRLDRFFGIPTHALSDGQWLAYRAARWHFVEAHIDPSKRAQAVKRARRRPRKR